MNSRTTFRTLLALAALALAGSLSIAQQPPAPPAPAVPSDGATQAAPVVRQPPSPGMRPGMRPRMGMNQPGNQAGPGMMANRANLRARFHGRSGDPMDAGLHMGPEGMWWKNPRVVQALTLTPDQVKRMDGVFQTSRLQLIDLKANVEKQEVMLEPLLSANPLDAAKAQAQIDKVADARADLEKAHAKMLLGIRGVLTPDQWTKLRDHGQTGGPVGGPGGPGGQGGPGPGMRGHGPGNGNMNNFVDPTPEP